MIISFGHICMELQANITDKFAFPCSITASSSKVTIGGSTTNQAIAAARSGAKVCVIGMIGNDLFGKTILDKLRHEGIQSSGIVKTDKATGIINSIINNKSQKAQILLEGANTDITSDLVPDTSLNERALLLLQDELFNDVNLEVLKRAKKRRVNSIMCFNKPDNINPIFQDHINISIINDNGKININNSHTITLEKPENFNSFCGTFAACIQAGLKIQRSIEYAAAAASIDSAEGFPYIDDIKSALKT